MKTFIYILAIVMTFTVTAQAQDSLLGQDSYVSGHYRNDGTYVQPHHRSKPNSNPYDNYSSQGNVNPYTGQAGTQNRNPNRPSSNVRGRRGSSYQRIPQGGSENGTGIVFGR